MPRGVQVNGAVISELRRSKALSQRALARIAGGSERTIRNAERNKILEAHIALYISTALGIPMDGIVSGGLPPSRTAHNLSLARRIG